VRVGDVNGEGTTLTVETTTVTALLELRVEMAEVTGGKVAMEEVAAREGP